MAKKKKTKSKKKTPQASKKPNVADDKAVAPKKKKVVDRKKDYTTGIIKTVYPAILGVIFGFISFYALGVGISGEETGMLYPWYFIMMVVAGATYYIQRYTYPFLNIDVEEFEGKDWLYVEFIAVDLWLLSWTLLLN